MQTGIVLDRYAYNVPVVRRKGESAKLTAGLRLGAFGVVAADDAFAIYLLATGALVLFTNDLLEAAAICGAMAMIPAPWETISQEAAEALKDDEAYRAGVPRVYQVMNEIRRVAGGLLANSRRPA